MSKTFLLLVVLLRPVVGTSAEQNVLQIIEESQRRTDANSVSYEGRLQVTNPRGKTSEKRWQLQRIDSHGSSKMMVRFIDPPKIKGVVFLMINHPQHAPDGWMWIPAAGHDRRIQLRNRYARFFDTDFNIDDLEERDPGQYDYELIGDATVDGSSCWTIRAVPRSNQFSPYTSLLLYIRRNDYAIAQVENYVGRDVVRRMRFGDIKDIQGIPTPGVIEAVDLRHHSRTTLTLDKLQYNVPMTDQDFTIEAIRRSK